jgi:serine/threonine-protein kinase
MGTPLYMSPEQVEGKMLDPRSDIYSLGITCYHMLAGELPFRGDTALSVAVQHLKTSPPRLENLRPDLPPALCRVVHKMLAKNPNDRYTTPRELMHDLRALPIDGQLDSDVAELEGWSDEEFGPMADSRLIATQRLQTLMRSSSNRTMTAARWAIVAVSVLFAFMVGAGIAYGTRERPLIEPSPSGVVHVDRKSTPETQFMYAMMANTEDAWKSVSLYFPTNEYYGRRARQQLARWYLAHDDFDQALALFNEFAVLPKEERQFRAFGLAGQTIVYGLQGRTPEAADKLAELWEYRDDLDPEMKFMIGHLVGKSRRQLGQQTLKNWEQWPDLRPQRGDRSGSFPEPPRR